MVDWRKLPVEMWGEIGQRLVGRVDVERFKAACKQCRASLPSRSRFPLRVPPLPDHSDFQPYFITEVNLYSVELVGSDRKALMEFEELENGIEINSFDPYKAIQVIDNFLHNFFLYKRRRLAFVAKAYRLHTAPSDNNSSRRWQCISQRVSKTVLISSNSNNVVANCRADQASYALACDHLSVVARFARGGKLAILRLGGSQDPNWGWDWVTPQQVVYQDIATYKGQLCAIDGKGRAFLMDYHSLQMTQVAAAPPTMLSSSVQLFNNALGELYLVITYMNMNMNEPKVDVKVFKLSGRLRCEWLEVDRHTTAGTQVFLRAMAYKVCIPRDVVAGMMECKSSRDRGLAAASLLVLPLPLPLEEDHMGDDADDTSCSFICFRLVSIPRFLWAVAPTYYSTPDALRAIGINDADDLISFACFLLTLFVFLYIFLFARR